MKLYTICFGMLALLFAACSDNNDPTPPPGPGTQPNKEIFITTDKACYRPGETVSFSIDNDLAGDVTVRYRHLGTVVNETPLAGKEWTWTPPATDYRGYMADVYETIDGQQRVLGSIAVDVSSDWKRFPRYGFLSSYDTMTESEIEAIIANLSRHHINGVQYQDWHYKHHRPLAGTPDNPAADWKDINNRNTSLATVRNYIRAAKNRGMKSMFYNLCFGALSDAAADGVREEWYLFKDRNRTEKDLHDLPNPFFWSDIYLTDPANVAWQDYLADRNSDVYAVFDFDGYHIDQLGNRGTVYDYAGNRVVLPDTYESFINRMKQAHPDKRLVMNAVSRFGQEQIARTGVDFFYNEVWGEDSKYADLVDILEENNRLSNGKLATVFAAYLNYNIADNKGQFNTPGVLLADAVMFAFGGSHLELGEHMLGKEYFPNNNLTMKPDLQKALVHYYDFLTAYQNLLRDGGSFNKPEVNCTNSRMSIASWPPQAGKVASVGKEVGTRQVVHLLNLSQANYFDWRDMDGNMPEPALIEEPAIEIRTTRTATKVWIASPDVDGGAAHEVDFNQNSASISLKLPSLKYWYMIVIE